MAPEDGRDASDIEDIRLKLDSREFCDGVCVVPCGTASRSTLVKGDAH